MTHDRPPTLMNVVRRFEHRIGEIRNFEPDLGDRAAPRLTPIEVLFKPGGHCDPDRYLTCTSHH